MADFDAKIRLSVDTTAVDQAVRRIERQFDDIQNRVRRAGGFRGLQGTPRSRAQDKKTEAINAAKELAVLEDKRQATIERQNKSLQAQGIQLRKLARQFNATINKAEEIAKKDSSPLALPSSKMLGAEARGLQRLTTLSEQRAEEDRQIAALQERRLKNQALETKNARNLFNLQKLIRDVRFSQSRALTEQQRDQQRLVKNSQNLFKLQKLIRDVRFDQARAAERTAKADERAAKAAQRTKANRAQNAALGVGFPLLFGGGPGSVLGGGLGALAGGFGGSVIFSAIGAQIDALVGSVRKLGDASKDATSFLDAAAQAGFNISESTRQRAQDLIKEGQNIEAFYAVLAERYNK